MADSELIEFGAHTHTHAILARLSTNQVRREITESLEAVRKLTGRPCILFSYPNGGPEDYDERALRILDEGGEHRSRAPRLLSLRLREALLRAVLNEHEVVKVALEA